MTLREPNRILVLDELSKKSKWLHDELGKNQTTVSQWCNNVRQPSIEKLAEITYTLDVDIRQLLNPTKEK